MSIALESLIFDANTDKLKDAVGIIDNLTDAVTRLAKAQADEAKSALQSEKTKREQAKTLVIIEEQKSRESAKTAAIVVESEERANRARQKSVDSANKSADASSKLDKLIKNLSNTYSDLANGMTKGESNILNFARSLGATSDQIQIVTSALKDIGSLTKNPFDASLGAVRSISQEFDKLQHRVDLANKGIVLSTKQLSEYSRIATELAAKMTSAGVDISQGSGLTEFNRLLTETQHQYLGLAQQVNNYTDVEKELQRQKRESANASRALAAEEERMLSIMNSMTDDANANVSATERSAQAIARYERNLRLAGVGAEEAAKKLALYKQQMLQVQQVDQDRRAQHLARALTPQISDIVTSLAGGMPLHLIIMQQGLQIRDMISMAGVETQKLQQVFKTASADMVKSITGTVHAIGTLLVGALVDAGKAVGTSLLSPFVATFEAMKLLMNRTASDADVLRASLNGMVVAFGNAAKILTGSLIAAVLALGAAFLYVDSQQTKLSASVNRYGASLGITAQEALNMAVQSEYATGTIVESIQAVAKAGGFTKDQLETITESAARSNKVFGESVDSVVEKYVELRKDPVKGLLELQAQTGRVDSKVLEHIKTLVKQGDTYGAVQAAIDEYAAAIDRSADAAEEASGITKSFITQIKEAWTTLFKDIQRLALIAAENIAYVFNAIGNTIGGAAAAAVQAVQGNFEGAKEIWDAMGRTADENRVRMDALNATLTGKPVENTLVKEAEQELASLQGKLKELQDMEKSGEFSLSRLIAGDSSGELLDKVRSAEERVQRLKQVQKEVTDALNQPVTQETQGNSALAQWELRNREVMKNTLSDKEKYLQKMKELDAEYSKGVELGASPEQLEQIRAAQAKLTEEFKKKSGATKESDQVTKEYEKTIDSFQKMQVKAVGSSQELTQAEVQLQNVMRSDAWGKYTEAQKLAILHEYELAKAAQLSARAFEEQEKALSKLYDLFSDMDMSNLETSKEIESQNAELAFQYSLLGKTDDEVKNITRAYETQRKTLEINNRYELQRIELAKKYNEEISKVNDPLERFIAEQTYQDELQKMRINQAEELANVQSEAQLRALQEYDAEFRRIQGELAELIWVAISEGGSKGAEALSDLLEQELKKIAMKPINIMVNFVMNSISGMLGLGSSSAQGGSMGGGLGGISDILSLGSQVYSGSMSLSNAVGTAYANATGTGIDGLLATNNAYGTSAGGVSGLGTGIAGFLGGFAGSAIFGGRGQSGLGGSLGASLGYAAAGSSTTMLASLGSAAGPVGAVAGMLIGAALGSLLGGKPSNKAAWGEVNLATGETANLGNMTGKKQASPETIQARDALLASIYGFATVIEDIGGNISLENIKIDVGERDGIKVDFGEGMESLGRDAEAALNEVAARLIADAYDSLTAEQKAIVDSLEDDSLRALQVLDIASNGVIKFLDPLEAFADANSELAAKFEELGIEMPKSLYEFNALAETLDLTTQAGQDLALGMQELAPEFAALQMAAVEMLGFSTESIKSLFQTVMQEATSADEARKMAAESAEAMIYEGLGNMLLDQVTSMVMDGIIGPMAMQLVGAAASSAAMTTSGAAIAASSMATGGAIGGTNVATGGAMGGGAVAQGGAAAGSYLSAIVGQAKAAIGAFTAILKDPEVQSLIKETGAAIGEISASMFSSGAFKVSGGGGGAGSSGSGGGGGGGGGSTQTEDPLQKAYDLLIKVIAKEKELAKERLDAINKIYEISINAAKKLYGEVDSTVKQTYQQSRLFFNESLQGIMQGILPDADKYKEAVDNLMKEISDTAYATKADADRARLLLANELQSVADQLEPEKTALEKQLEYLESLEKTAKEQLDALKGNTEATTTLVQAIAQWQGISGLTLPAFASGGAYQGGLALVGEEGPELINFSNPGQVYSASQTAGMLRGSSTDLTQQLVYEVQMLRAEVRADVTHNAKTAKLLDRVVPDGRSVAVTASIDGGTL